MLGGCFSFFKQVLTFSSTYTYTHTVTSITSTSLCLLVSCATSVYSAAFLGCGAFYIIFMLASGFVLQADEIPSYLAPFKYLSFYRYVRLA